jgi:hypothetical protein
MNSRGIHPSVYLAAHPVEAEIVRQYLHTHGITAVVAGAYGFAARGELPVDVYPRLLLEDARDFSRARELIAQYERQRDGRLWRCSGCGEQSPEHFAVCWQCGHSD